MPILTALKTYERHLSAAAMIGGFVVDNFAFGRVDHPATQIVLASYLLIAASSIISLHFFEERHEQKGTIFRWSAILSALTQFAFGGLWSAFLIFYSRSAVIETAWPFLLVLAIIFVGNEVFRDYRSRLVFTAILFFFAFFSYATFVVPIFRGTIDPKTFLISDGLSVFAFVTFLSAVAMLARSRIRRDIGKITIGATSIFVVFNLFYYMNILPPLPLALADAQILYSKEAASPNQSGALAFLPWYQQHRTTKVYPVYPGQPLYAYSAVFAPLELSTQIRHEWEWYNLATHAWVTETVVNFPIVGGRTDGYRGYSFKSQLPAGEWRVDIETPDGRIIGRVKFTVEQRQRIMKN